MLVATGCGSSLPSTDLPPTREVSPASGFPDFRDYRGVLDCRMKAAGLDETKLAELAKQAQLDFVALGDNIAKGANDYGVAGFTDDILFLPGGGFPIGPNGARIVGINLHDPINAEADAPTVIRQIRNQGALAVAAEPLKFGSPNDYAPADAIEIYNQESVWRAQNESSLYWRAFFFSSDFLFSDLDVRPADKLAAYDRMSGGARVVMLAGMGAPADMSVMGSKVGTFRQLFEVYSTHVLATERQIDPIVAAIKHGHCYISFDFLGYVPNLGFWAEDATRTMIGDEAPLTPTVKLHVEMPGPADEVRIFGDGIEAVRLERITKFDFKVRNKGAYRLEAYRNGHPWIYTNPIYIR